MRNKLSLFFGFLFVISFISCEVGLGSAVDTGDPVVNITYPSENAIIRESFVVSGTCDDETGINRVEIYVKKNGKEISGSRKVAPFSDDSKTTWKTELNVQKNGVYPFEDGSDYIICAQSFDNAGRKSAENTIPVTIDNTAPFVVLTNPSTVLTSENSIEDASGFGSSIKIQGTANDLTIGKSATSLTFTVFDQNDNFIAQRTMNSVPSSLGLTIGEYEEDGTSQSNEFYKTLYGEVGEIADTKYYKFKISVSDAARTYKGEGSTTSENERGNVSDCYYLYDDIYTPVIFENSTDLDAVYEIIKKNLRNETLSATEKTILETLEKFKNLSDDEYLDSSADSSRAATTESSYIKPVGIFSLTPKNNPTYEITSLDTFNSSAALPWEGKSISSSGSISILAKPGPSDAPLDSKTFKLVIYKTDEKGNRIAATESDKNEDYELKNVTWKKNGSNYTGKVSLSTDDVVVAQYYGIELKGSDQTGLEFYNGSTVYRFVVQKGTTPPNIQITKYNVPNVSTTVYLKEDSADNTKIADLVVSGTAESRSGASNSYVTLWPIVNTTEYLENKTSTEGKSDNSWSLTIPGSCFDDSQSDVYTVTIYAVDETSNPASKEITVVLDKEAPVIQIDSVNNVVTFDADTTISADGNTFDAKKDRGYVNEKITISGSVYDDNFSSGSWSATCDGKEIASGKLTTSKIKIEIDTTLGTDGKELNLEYKATDKAGHESTEVYKYYDKNPLVISQMTDYPRVSLSNASLDITEKESISSAKNLFDSSSNNRIMGSTVDDDGIDTIKIEYSKYDEDNFSLLYNGELKGSGTSCSINAELKDSTGSALAEGFYKIRITVKDKKTENVKTTVTEPFAVCINNGAPTITFTNPIKYSEDYQSATEFTVTGSVTGELGTERVIKRGSVSREIKEDNTWSDVIKPETDSDGISLNSDTGVYTIKYSVTDSFGRTVTDEVTFKIDREKPVSEITQVSPLVTGSSNPENEKFPNGAVNGKITVQGTAKDNDRVSSSVLKIYKVQEDGTAGEEIQSLSYDGNVKTGEAITIPAGISNTVNNFKFSVDTTKLAENFDNSGIILRLESTDKSGNIGTSDYAVYVCQETDIPTLTFKNGAVDCYDEKEIKVGKNLFGMGSDKLYIHIEDDDGVKSVSYTVDGVGEMSLLDDGKSTTYDCEIDISALGVGVHSLRFFVSDVADISRKAFPNESDFIKIAYDNDVPSLGEIKIFEVSYESNMFVPKSYSISGTASDANGIAKITVKNTKASEEISVTLEDSDSGKKTWKTVSIQGSEGNNSVTVTAEDNYGRTTKNELKFIVDTVSPTWQKNEGTESSPDLKDSETVVSASSKSKKAGELSDLGKNFWFNQKEVTLSGNAYDKNGIGGYVLTVNSNEPVESSGGSSYSILSSYKEGQNSAKLVVKDKAGNSADRTVLFYVDTEKPKIESSVVAGGVTITNAEEITINVSAKDTTSGISKILVGTDISFNESTAIGKVELDSVQNEYTGSVNVDLSRLTEGNYTFYIRAEDKAGLSSDDAVIKDFVIDRTPPVVTYSSPSSDSTVNKLTTIRGLVADSNLDENATPYLYYRKTDTTTWSTEKIEGVYVSANKSWSIDFLTTDKCSDKTNYDVQVRFTDKAGNTNTDSFLKLYVDQDSDTPVVVLNGIKLDGTTRLNSNEISGSVEDDDGDVTALWIKTSSTAGWTQLEVTKNGTGGTWRYTLPVSETAKNADGNYELYLKVQDACQSTGSYFATDKLDDGGKLYIRSSLSTTEKVETSVKFSVDTTAPKIELVDVSFDDGATYLNTNVSNNQNFGGVKNKNARFKINAKDTVTSAENLKVVLNIDGTDRPASYNESESAYICDVDCSGITSGIYQLKVTATDEAGMADTFSRSVVVDNSAPDTIKNITPNSQTEVTGEFTFSGLIEDDENANSRIESGKIYYYIPKYTEKDTNFTATDFTDNFAWTQENLTQTQVSWSIEFKGLATKLGYDSATGKLSSDYNEYKDDDNEDLFNIPVWFKASDTVGNIGYITKGTFIGESDKKEIQLKFNPNADKPTVQITYPEHDVAKNGFSYTILGGTIRFAGTASDNEGIDSVYLQFDLDGDETFQNGIKKDGTMISGAPFTKDKVVLIPVKGEKGVRVDKGTVSWSHSIDVSGLQNLDNPPKVLRVRACAVDNDTTGGQLASAWSNIICISVNNSVPQITVDKLRQYDATDTSLSSAIKEIAYSDGDYISGKNWYLEGTFEDSDGIDLNSTSATVNGTKVDGNFTDVSDLTAGTKYSFKIPVSAVSGTCTMKLVVKDNDSSSPQTAEREYSLKIDNTAPDFDEGNGETLVLYKGGYGTDGTRLDNTSNFIQNSNGASVTIASRVREAGSGFSSAVFYFTREYATSDGTTTTRVFNVSEGYGTNRTSNRMDISSSKTDGAVYINAEGLAVLYKNGVTRNADNTVLFDGLSSNKNIRKAGLVKIGGSYHKILDITGDVVTFEGECSTGFTETEFVYGMVVDTNDNGSGTKDDGDGMAESYSKAGEYWTWDGTVNSANIPDGPIAVNVVVFDKAGNFRKGSVETRISNSPVRITSVKLATDLNSNGTFEESEYQQFYAFKNADGTGNTSKGIDIWNLDTKEELYGNSATGKYWAVRDRLSVIPEFVGGTAPFYWNFAKDTDGGNLTTANALTASDTIKIQNKGEFTLDNTDLGSSTGEGKDVTYQFSFWDSTEELTPGTNTSWTVLNAHVRQELTDSSAPTITISPFYWKSSSDNSLYKNSKEQGHIELESDLPTTSDDATATTFSDTNKSGLYDKDPKVSGIIKIQGTANDNKILKEIKVKIPGILNDYTTVGTYTTGSGWDDTKAADIDSKLESGAWAFTVDSENITQADGHTIKWTLTVDTAKITNVAELDVAVQVKATDQSSNPSSESTTQTAQGAETGYYRVDVVPYISALHTTNRNKSGLKDNNIRSAQGKYSIIKGVTSDFITVEGFNLSPSAVRLVSTDDLSKEVTTSSGIGLTYKSGTSSNFTVSNNISKSGYLEVFTNGIRALNNVNKNDAKGTYSFTGSDGKAQISDYKDMPNREADYYSTKNVTLTDDRYLRVFDMKDTPIKNGYYPTMVMNGDNPVFGYIDLNGVNEKYRSTSVPSNGTFGFVSGCYQTQKAEFVAETGAIKNGNIDYMFGTIQSDQVAFAKDSAGKYYYASVYNYDGAHISVVYDSYAENHTWTYYYGTRYDGWGDGVGYSGYGGDYAYNSNNNAISLEATNYGNGLLIGRYQNLRMLAKGDSTTSTGASVYMAYYDDNTTNKDVIFRTFKVGKNTSWSNQMQNGIRSNLPDQNTSGRISVGTNASSYLDLGVTSDNHVVIVYYDLSEACLKLKYSSATVDGSSITPNVTWKESSIKFPDYVGAYVSLAIDSEDHIHIAAFDSSDSDLTYFYIDRYDSTVCLQEKIDQANSVGQWTRIALNSENIPYIAYYNSTETGSRESIKLAYANSVGASSKAGVDSNGYTTGSWEYMTVPAINPPQGGDSKFKNVNLGFDTEGTPVVGYLGTNIEFGKWLSE